MSYFGQNTRKLAVILGLLLGWNVASTLLPISWSIITTILGLPITLFLPGLFIAILLGAKRLTATTTVFSVGLSILTLMVVGLGANFLPMIAGISRPLDTPTLHWLFNAVFIALAFLAAKFGSINPPITKAPNISKLKPGPNWAVIAAATTIPLTATMGAITLNNHGPNTLSLIALGLVSLVVPSTFLLRRRLSDTTLLFTIAATTLGLLLATSLRSWYISGQDMQHEYQVFNLALQLGRWDIGYYREPYNACLSITLLPVALTSLLKLSGVIVFKVIAQLIFVTAPLTIFTLVKQFLGRTKAFIAAILFIGLPTLTIDVPFISRQEIAFVFVALALAAIFVTQDRWVRRHRSALFIALSLGVVVSHYSTAYLFIGPVVLAYITTKAIALFRKPNYTTTRHRYSLSVWVVIAICIGTYLWLAQITRASDDLGAKLGRAASSVTHLVQDPTLLFKSLGAPGGNGPEAGLRRYVNKTIADPTTNADAVLNTLKPVESNAPATSFSRWVQAHTGIDLSKIVHALYYGLATKLYLLFIGIGTIQLLRPSVRAKLNSMPLLFPAWCVATGIVLVSQLLLPGLAENYGITRAFMQAFIILSVPMIVGFDAITSKWRRLQDGLLMTLATGLLVLYSGLLPQLTGGLHRQISLDNSGQYYGTIYPHATDLAAYSWIQNHIPEGSKINIADFAALYAYYPQSPFDTTAPGVMPFQVKSGDYALLSQSQTKDHIVYTFDNLVGLTINPSMYNQADLIYTTGSTQLYRKN